MLAKIISNEKIGDAVYRMKLDAGKKISAKPGQFINVLVSEAYTPLLRRPFSIYDSDGRRLEIVYKVLGDATKILSLKKPGETVDFLGPLGNPYPVSKPETKNSKLIIIGGGTGAASTYFLAKYLKSKKHKFIFIQGARNKAQMVAPEDFKKLGCTFVTDDGSMGKKGLVTDVLLEILESGVQNQEGGAKERKHVSSRTPHPSHSFIIFACGPKPMFRALKAVADKKKNVDVYASFEEYMGCGIGACLSCVVEFKKGDYTEYKRVCKDGTVFNLEDVIF